MENKRYFAKLRKKESAFYQKLWDELEQIKIIDTHEHLLPMQSLIKEFKWDINSRNIIRIPDLFRCSYIYELSEHGNYEIWAQELKKYRGTGYLKAWMIAFEDLYGISPPITPKYVEEIERAVNDAYREDLLKNKYKHFNEVLNKANIEFLINNIDFEEHLSLPQSRVKAAAGIPTILNGWLGDNISIKNNVVVKYITKIEKKELSEIKTFEDYQDATERLLNYFRSSGHYCCVKFQTAYERPLTFWDPDPSENYTMGNIPAPYDYADEPIKSRKANELFNNIPKTEWEKWRFGDSMLHFIFEWMAFDWNVPIQVHTGLARIYNGGSNAMNLSNLFLKFPMLHFDLFHGNYPYNNLAGMLHQIPNISADLCWLPAISPAAAQRTLTELFEVGDMVSSEQDHQPGLRTSLFGGDSRMIEGTYGALQLAKDVLIRTLEDLYNRGMILKEDAIDLAENVLYSNPKRIFSL